MNPTEPLKFAKTDLLGNRYLSFALGAEEYAIPVLVVKEVIALPDITPIPFSQAFYLGVMNLRGLIISVVDLRTKLGIKAQTTAETSVIICDLAPLCIGFVVDSISAVLAPSPEEIANKPEVQASKNADYITGVVHNGEKLVMLMDIAKALGAGIGAGAKKKLAA